MHVYMIKEDYSPLHIIYWKTYLETICQKGDRRTKGKLIIHKKEEADSWHMVMLSVLDLYTKSLEGNDTQIARSLG